MLNACAQLSFRQKYIHVAAHQDEVLEFHSLSHAEQLNCAVDAGAKWRLIAVVEEGQLSQMAFPLEPIVCLPRMFQVWACKQVLGIAHTKSTVNEWDKGVDPCCPSCW